MKKIFHYILQAERPVISCDIDLKTYYVGGEEVTQDEIITVLAVEFDNEATRLNIADDMAYLRTEMEEEGKSDKEIDRASRSYERWPVDEFGYQARCDKRDELIDRCFE